MLPIRHAASVDHWEPQPFTRAAGRQRSGQQRDRDGDGDVCNERYTEIKQRMIWPLKWIIVGFAVLITIGVGVGLYPRSLRLADEHAGVMPSPENNESSPVG